MTDAARAADFLRQRLGAQRPEMAVVLGSGLGGIAASLADAVSIETTEVPGFPASTVAGHAGRIYLGRWAERRVLLFQGRVHLYEGHEVETVTLGVRCAAELGAKYLVLTNAAGSCSSAVGPGSLMRATDLLDLFFRRLRGNRAKPFIGRGGALDPKLCRLVDEAAALESIPLAHGVMCGSSGPAYETAAEIRLQRTLDAQAACMSTIPEVFAAVDCGMRVAVISLITNFGTGVSSAPLNHAEVVEWAAKAGEDLGRLLLRLAALLPGDR
jgi:inosine/guanosine/xanthosine phosphorylase family protein